MVLHLSTLVQEIGATLALKVVAGETGLDRILEVPDVNRPGLALSGFLDYFPAERLQIMGKTEVTFWHTLPPETRKRRLEEIVTAFKPAGFVVTHDSPVPRELTEACERSGVALLATPMPTTKFISEVTLYLEEKLAPVVTAHGSLVDVYGVGVLLIGESGIGKSECALALLDKGHRLCADDVVEIRRTPEKTLLGAGVRALRYHMEIRGLGIVDVQSLFGARAVRERKLVELVVQLVHWEPGKRYDRTGLEDHAHVILDIPLVMHELPVKPGRNLAVLVEAAAMNWRLRQMGVNPAERLNEQILASLTREGGAEPAPSPRPSASRRKRHEER